MKNKTEHSLFAMLLWFGLILGLSQTSIASDLKNDNAAVVGQFKKELKSELMLAISQGGAVHAISVCAEKAPLIASRLSRMHGVKLQRISDRVRNPLNTPSESQSELLNFFTQNPDESSVFIEEAGSSASVYAEAIRIEGPCLLCHGSSVSTEVLEKLNAQYPFDRASGYELGELRGLFSVEREATNSRQRAK
ncbi:MAG: DUF3365 domain-containing protein [Pseudomonadales bacterium]